MTDIRLKPFDGKMDFAMWLMRMEGILVKEKYWRAVSEEWLSPTSDQVKKDLKQLALAEIMMRLTDDVARPLMKIKDPKVLWDSLKTTYQTKSLPNRIFLLKKLFTFKMELSLSIQENLDIFLRINQDLERCEDAIKEEHQAVILLSSLPHQFDGLIDVIQFGREDLTLAKITGFITLKNESLRVFKQKNGLKQEVKSEVMFAKTNPKFNPKSNKSHKSKANSKESEKKLENVKCFHCGEMGNYMNGCPKRNKQDHKKKEQTKTDYTNVCETQYQPEILVVANSESMNAWILDSGCTMHASPHKSLFDDIKLCDGGEVKLGDTTTLKIMEDKGCQIISKNGTRDVLRDDHVVIRSMRLGGLYHVSLSPELNIVHASDKNLDETKLWHARLGHIGNKGLFHLFKNGLIKKKPCDIEFCEICILGKKTEHAFGKSKVTVNKKLEYVHSDLWGPAQVSTAGGRNYFVSFIDYYSRRVWIYLLKSKTEVLDCFKSWKLSVESETDLKVKCLRTDNGLEFCNKFFDDYCAENGIKRHLTVSYTPQQNGIAKRMNRTLLEKARCMLISSDLKSSMWGEAVICAAYLINRSPCSAIEFKVPLEMWLNKKIHLEHLRPFGCTAYAKVSEGKLEPRAIKTVMLGYLSGCKGYKLLVIQPGAYKVIRARSVTFNEKDFHFKNLITNAPTVVSGPSQDTTDFIPAGYFMGNQGGPNGDGAGDAKPAGPQGSGGHLDLHTPPRVSLGNQEEGRSDQHEDHGSNLPHQRDGDQLSLPSSSTNRNLPVSHNDIDVQDASQSNSGGGTNVVCTDLIVHNFAVSAAMTDDTASTHADNDLSNYVLARDRTLRIRFQNKRYANVAEFANIAEYAVNVAEKVKFVVPETYDEAMKSKDSDKWK
ncbi:unnamed protein product [Rhodiola kirilowii]